jgi:molybdopterin synthase catalytic subunit
MLVKLTRDPIRDEELLQDMNDVDCGARLLFYGMTRCDRSPNPLQYQPDAQARGRPQSVPANASDSAGTEYLVYDAYLPMAQRALEKIVREATERWPLSRINLIHRLGRVDLGEASIGIAIISPHRRPALEAMGWLLDRLKQDVPIWKEEHWTDGSTEWVHRV